MTASSGAPVFLCQLPPPPKAIIPGRHCLLCAEDSDSATTAPGHLPFLPLRVLPPFPLKRVPLQIFFNPLDARDTSIEEKKDVKSCNRDLSFAY